MKNPLNALARKKVFVAGKIPTEIKSLLLRAIKASQGTLVSSLDASVAYAVTPDGTLSGSHAAKQAALQKKGVLIPVLDLEGFAREVSPTAEQIATLIRAGERGADAIKEAFGDADEFGLSKRECQDHGRPRFAVVEKGKFDRLDLSGFDLSGIRFEKCSFVGCKLSETIFANARDCDFSRAEGEDATFFWIDRSRFKGAKLPRAYVNSHLEGTDFASAHLDGAKFDESFWGARVNTRPSTEEVTFTGASLQGAAFDGVWPETAANFDGANLAGARIPNGRFNGMSCRKADFRGAILIGTSLQGASCAGANFDDANLAQAKLDKADLATASLRGCNLRGASTKGAKLPKSLNVRAATAVQPKPPLLAKLDQALQAKGRARVKVCVRQADGSSHELQFSCYGSAHAYTYFPDIDGLYLSVKQNTMSNVLQNLGNVFATSTVDFGGIQVESSGTSLRGKQFKDLIIQCIAAAFDQQPPAADDLRAALKSSKKVQEERRAAEKAQRDKEQAALAKTQAKANQKLAKAIQKVGQVTDLATFLTALALRIEKAKIDKATAMLKASRFKLFNEVTGEHVTGVVKSQTDPDLVYACQIRPDGSYACCTQNLNICGGLRGSICKHLLVLIIGLVQAGELDPTTVDAWVAKTRGVKAALDRDALGEVFLRYKGAEAGELDWRPTETMPEDYYAM